MVSRISSEDIAAGRPSGSRSRPHQKWMHPAYVRSGIEQRAQLLARHLHANPGETIWQCATSPLWLGSGIPRPELPAVRARESWRVPEPVPTPQGAYLGQQMRSLLLRFWVAWICSATLRGLALGALAATIWTIGAIGGFAPQPHTSSVIAIIAVMTAIGLMFGLVTRPSTQRLATMLDRTFVLDERLTTAFDPTVGDDVGSMRSLQLADTANAYASVRPDIHGAAVLPIREMVVASLALICLVTALLFNIASTGIPANTDAPLPLFVPSSERFARQQQEQKAQELADLSKQPAAIAESSTSPASDQTTGPTAAMQDLATVGNALSTNALTKPAADKIATGDYAGAQSELRNAAAAASSLPADERNALADQLDRAADDVNPDNAALADATRKSADDLRAGGDQGTQGLNDLADQIGASGDEATTSGQPSSQQQSAQGSSSSSQSGEGSSSEGSDRSGQSGDSGESAQSGGSSGSEGQGDPGSGMAAQPGIGSEPGASASSQSGDGTGAGDASAPGGQQPGSAGDSANPGEGGSGDQPGGAGSSGAGQASSSDASGNANGNADGRSDQGGASQGAGAGSGESDSTSENSQGGAGGGSTASKPSDTAGNGKASSDPPPGDPNQKGAASDTPSSAQKTDQSLVLQGTSDEDGVGTGNDVGSSSSGSGSGTGAASGSATQGVVGPAGPDSNSVPDEYRDLVRDYFDGDGTQP